MRLAYLGETMGVSELVEVYNIIIATFGDSWLAKSLSGLFMFVVAYTLLKTNGLKKTALKTKITKAKLDQQAAHPQEAKTLEESQNTAESVLENMLSERGRHL